MGMYVSMKKEEDVESRQEKNTTFQEQTRDVVRQLLYECISLEDKNWAGYVSHCEKLEADALELVLSESLEDPEEIVDIEDQMNSLSVSESAWSSIPFFIR